MKEEDVDLIVVVTNVYMVSNAKGWWVNTGATRHICGDGALFTIYEKTDVSEKLYMGNASAFLVVGKGKVLLKWTSRKILTLNDVCHVLEIRKNLVSGTLLNKNGFKLVFESDKFTLTKRGMYVGQGYLLDGMFKLNVLAQVPKNSDNKNKAFAYIAELCDVWHSWLGHANYRSL